MLMLFREKTLNPKEVVLRKEAIQRVTNAKY